MVPVGNNCGHVAACGVPLHVSAHEVLVATHGGEIVAVVPLQVAGELAQAREEQRAPLGAPEELIRRAPLQRGDQAHLRGALDGLHGVDGHVVLGAVPGDEREAHALGLPREGHRANILVFKLEHLDGHVAVAHAQELEGRVDSLLRFGVPVHLDGEEVALGVPEENHVVQVEEVLLAHLLARGQVHDRHARRVVGDLRHPEGYAVLSGAPLEVLDAVDLDGRVLARLVLDELHRVRVVDVEAVLAEARHVLVLVRKLEDRPHHLPDLLRPRKRAALGTRGHVPDDDRLRGLGERAPRDEEALAGAKVHELDAFVAKLHELLPRRAAKQDNAQAVEADEVPAVRAP
mmetsp:Transcript_3436/g.9796  ORF Transcript_3436/g.9796 Transcript_3436/m.9796 type:complete len:346 (-) Transcript_3436:687-1724(-)